ncbi:MAG TPA: HAD-IIA family hydrolase [Acidimicrobiales bacterium]|nr:HAD-IIA family hydrolase [Acidimicrobiales bacterium]
MTGPATAAGTWLVDLDGVIWLAEHPIPGAADAVTRLRAAGVRIVFVTNNSAPTTAEFVARLAAAGIDVDPGDLVSSAHAAASMVPAGSRVLVCAEGGILEALAARDVEVVEEGPVDAVIVGWTRRFDFDMLADAATAVRAGARLIGTNEDPTHPTPERLLPGSGAFVAAVATASQTEPEIAGKPHEPLVALVRDRVPDAVLVVGDRPATDGLLARRLGLPYALVLSGVIEPGHGPLDVDPDEEAADLAGLVDRHLGG